VDIGGLMYFWGLTIDTVSCIAVVIGIGLSVDYSAHIGHTFMNQQGVTRDERICDALQSIGPAVFHGGFSTFLAFLFLADSDSHVFRTFFKVPSARLTLHSMKLCTKFKIFKNKQKFLVLRLPLRHF
jgi:predicted RND superfamily exporter protein